MTNQKDYKAIAEINKKLRDRIITHLYKENRVKALEIFDLHIKSQADYFEKENRIMICNTCNQPVKNLPGGGYECVVCNSYPYKSQVKPLFSRKQFLEWCGVEE